MTQPTASMKALGAIALLIGGCTFEVPFGNDRPDGDNNRVDGGTTAPCRPAGCSGQICADSDVASTCEWREEYACYRGATCERQPGGQCGWTPTPELRACLTGGGRPDGGVTPPVCRTPDGRTLAVGERYNDGCNDCTCTAGGGFACTERACEDAGAPVVCRTADGRTLRVGETYNDGCNDCTCLASGGVACTRRACVDGGIPVDLCRPTGCSGQICAEHAVESTCEWREEYACYRSATCERQPDGLCGWTQTPELRACLTGGRPDSGVTPPPVCRTPDGRTLAVGERYNDGCNDCTCTAGGSFSCTERACADAGIPVDLCRPTGCSGQICAEHAVASTCEWREEYACYRSATCERQSDGLCGWTQTPELRACLASR